MHNRRHHPFPSMGTQDNHLHCPHDRSPYSLSVHGRPRKACLIYLPHTSRTTAPACMLLLSRTRRLSDLSALETAQISLDLLGRRTSDIGPPYHLIVYTTRPQRTSGYVLSDPSRDEERDDVLPGQAIAGQTHDGSQDRGHGRVPSTNRSQRLSTARSSPFTG
jgi:hypothetical protein